MSEKMNDPTNRLLNYFYSLSAREETPLGSKAEQKERTFFSPTNKPEGNYPPMSRESAKALRLLCETYVYHPSETDAKTLLGEIKGYLCGYGLESEKLMEKLGRERADKRVHQPVDREVAENLRVLAAQYVYGDEDTSYRAIKELKDRLTDLDFCEEGLLSRLVNMHNRVVVKGVVKNILEYANFSEE